MPLVWRVPRPSSVGWKWKVDVLVSNYQGTAAEKLRIDVILLPAPVILWSFGLLMTVFGIYLVGVKKCEQVSGEIGALALFPIFLCDLITPLDPWDANGLVFRARSLGALASGVAAGSQIHLPSASGIN